MAEARPGTPADGRVRAVIDAVRPGVDRGRCAVKRITGDAVEVEADCFADGHDALRAVLLWRPEAESAWREVEMTSPGNDRWTASFVAGPPGGHRSPVGGAGGPSPRRAAGAGAPRGPRSPARRGACGCRARDAGRGARRRRRPGTAVGLGGETAPGTRCSRLERPRAGRSARRDRRALPRSRPRRGLAPRDAAGGGPRAGTPQHLG